MNLVEPLNLEAFRLMQFLRPWFYQTTIVMTAVVALDLLLRKRLRAAVRYAVWLLVLVKLVLPPSLASPTAFAYWLQPPGPTAVPPTDAAPSPAAVVESFAATPRPELLAKLPEAPALTQEAWLVLGWFSGMSVLLGVFVYRWRKIRRLVIEAEEGRGALRDLLSEAAGHFRLWRTPPIKLIDSAAAPGVCGVFRPVILLPKSLPERLSRLQLRTVLLHELSHIGRGDTWVNWAQGLLQAVFWWHPLLWFVNARIRQVREEAADDAVRVALAGEADSYPATLLEVARHLLARPLASLGLLGMFESRSRLKQRVARLLNNPAPKSARLNLVSITGCILLGLVLLPMAQGQRAASPALPGTPGSRNAHPPQSVILQAHYIVLTDQQRAELMAGLTPARVTSDLSRWILDPEDLDLVLSRAEIQGGRQPGSGIALLSGERVATPSGQSAIVPGGIILPIVSREGSRAEGRISCRSTSNGREAFWGNLVQTQPVIEGRDISVSLKVQGATIDPPVKLNESDKIPMKSNQPGPLRTNFVFSTDATFHVGGGVLFEGAGPRQPDGKICLVLLAGSAMPTAQVVGKVIVEVLAKGQYRFQGRVFDLDALHVALKHEKDRHFTLHVKIEREPVASEESVKALEERLRWLIVEHVSVDGAPEGSGQVLPDAALQGSSKVKSALSASTAARPDIQWLPDSEMGVPHFLQAIGRQEIVRKLRQMILPEVNLVDHTLREVVDFLAAETRKHDPDKQGVNFIINSTEGPRVPLSATGESLAHPRFGDLETNMIKLDPALSYVRVTDLLDAIVKGAAQPIRYSIIDYGVIFSRRPEGTELLQGRTFVIRDPKAFIEGLKNVGASSTPQDDPGQPPNLGLLRDFFAKVGVDFSPRSRNTLFFHDNHGRSFDDHQGLLYVRASATDLEIIEAALQVVIREINR